MIVDYIELGKEHTDMEFYKKRDVKEGLKKHPIVSFVPKVQGPNIQFKILIPFANIKMDELFPWIVDIKKKMTYDDSIEIGEVYEEWPINTKLCFAKMKTVWPVGPRDMLMA